MKPTGRITEMGPSIISSNASTDLLKAFQRPVILTYSQLLQVLTAPSIA